MVSRGWSEGGKGTTELAEAVIQEIANDSSDFKPLYKNTDSIKHKI